MEGPFLQNLESSSSKYALCQVWLKLAKWFRRKRFSNLGKMYFWYFVIISPWKRVHVCPFICTNLIPFTQENQLCQVWLKLPHWFLRRFLNIIYVYSLFYNYFNPLGKGCGPSFDQMNSFHPRMLCAKIGWNWPTGSCEEDFSNFVNVFTLFVSMSSRKRALPFIWINLKPFPQWCFVSCLVEIDPVVLKKKMKM